MCGIAGMLGRPDRDVVERMARAMIHRGPDADGFFADDRIALGFRRLAIIDVAGGDQPLTNEDGSIHVVFNGEIYNHRPLRRELERRGHRFRCDTDGEVLSHLYEEVGPDLVDRLNGIFAFAIWDARRKHLLLARDHHGVKPLYFAERSGSLLFASELKALLASGLVERELDAEAVAQYLVYQAVPPPKTIVAGVEMLPPGSRLESGSGRARVTRYWQPPMQAADPIASEEEATEIVRAGLDAAVQRQLMSERSLGLFLSGGVDSSVLVALASRQTGRRLKTFSVGFVGPDERLLTEWPWARLVAERYGTDHAEFVLTERIFADRLPHVIEAMDQPTSDGINSYFVSLAAAEHVTVALSGTGGDELFLGYPRDARLLADYAQGSRFRPLRPEYVEWLTRRMPRDRSLWRRISDLADAARTYGRLDAELVSPRGIAIFDEPSRDRILDPDFRRRTFRSATDYIRSDVRPDAAQPGDWLSRVEQRAYMSFVLLRDIDAMSMAHSLEVRVPFLDVEFGAAVARIPWQFKLRDGCGKWILKRAAEPWLPPEILTRPKMGFGLPYNIWMRRSLEPVVRDNLSSDRIRRRGIFDPREVASLVDRFYRGDDQVWRQVWTLFILEAWASEMLDRSAVCSAELELCATDAASCATDAVSCATDAAPAA